MLTRAPDYRTLYDDFRWPIPERYNIGVDCTDKHDPAKPALIYRAADGSVSHYSFGDLFNTSLVFLPRRNCPPAIARFAGVQSPLTNNKSNFIFFWFVRSRRCHSGVDGESRID